MSGIGADIRGVGIRQNWQNVKATRSVNTAYQNSTNEPIQVYVTASGSSGVFAQVSKDNVNWINAGSVSADDGSNFIVPVGHFYRINGSVTMTNWSELRA